MQSTELETKVGFQACIDTLLARHSLRGETLATLSGFVCGRMSDLPWLEAFEWLLVMPSFLNIAVVAGACNSNCRMCSAGKNTPFRYLTASQFAAILRHAPTTEGITLSAGNSEPLMNPEFPAILKLAADRHIPIDFFTNGLLLTQELSNWIVDTRSVSMINFSFDAATEETYARIRRRDLKRLHSNVEYLSGLKKTADKKLPALSISMVEMSDNILELPALVDYAATVGAFRVYVEALLDPGGENQSALENPLWREAVLDAQRRAQAANINLQLPAKLRNVSSPSPCTAKEYPCCSWIHGVWIELDGKMSPCCVNASENLGNIYNTPLVGNQLYSSTKLDLLTRQVFPSCLKVAQSCEYLSALAKNGCNIHELATLSPTAG